MALKLSSGLVNAILDTHCFKNTMALGFLYIYSGLQPADADAIETPGAVNLLIITNASTATGLTWADATLNVIPKTAAPSEVWSGIGLVAGIAGWFRFYAAAKGMGASTSAVRFDGRVSAIGGGGDIELSSTTVAVGATTTISTATFTLPLSA